MTSYSIRWTLVFAAGALTTVSCSDDETTNEPAPTPLTIGTSQAADAIIDRLYQLDVVVFGGVPPYMWEVSGAPAGLAIDSDTGLISGTPAEDGDFTLDVLVTDSTGAQAEIELALTVTSEDPEPPPMLLDGPCDAPIALVPRSRLVTLFGRLPGTTSSSILCGGGDRASAYFSLELDARSDVRLGITSESDVAIGRPLDGCPPLRIVDDECNRVLSDTLPAGTQRFLLFGDPGAEISMTVEVEPNAGPSGPPTCEAPALVDLSNGPAMLMGDWTDAMDVQSATGCGIAAPGPEVVYQIDLAEAADLVITAGNVRAYLRSADCDAGPEIICEQGFGPIRLPNLAPGTYFLFLERSSAQNYQVQVEAEPPTPPAANFSCATAEQLNLANGPATIVGDFSNVPDFDSGSMCGIASVGRYYRFSLTAPGTVNLSETPQQLEAELLSGTCDVLTDLACADFSDRGICSPNLPAGDYVLRLSPFADTANPSYDLTLSTGASQPVPTNQTCATAEVITSTRAEVTASTVNANDDVALGMCHSDAAGDLFYRLDLAENADVEIDMLGGNTRFIYAIYSGACGNLVQLECGAGFSPLTALNVPAGPVTIVVEPRVIFNEPYACSDQAQQDFQMLVTAVPRLGAPSNDSCATPTVVAFPRGVGSAEVVSGTTRGATDTFSSVVCPVGTSSTTVNTPGSDVVYALDVPAAARLRVEVLGADTATRVSLLTACDGTGGALLCDSFGNAFETETRLAAGRYFVRVDHGLGSTPSDFFLIATLLP